MAKLYLGTREITPTILRFRYGASVETFLGNVNANGVLQVPSQQIDLSFDGVTDVASSVLYRRFYDTDTIKTVNFPDAVTISGYYAMYEAFRDSSNITTLNFPKLTTISGTTAFQFAFTSNASLTIVNFPELTTISGDHSCHYMFYSCQALQTLTFPKLSSITGDTCLGSLCYNSRGMQNIYFPALTSNSFGSYTNQFNSMLSGVTGCTVHFPSNLQSVIGSWTSVTAGFGGTNTSVLFDLTATT